MTENPNAGGVDPSTLRNVPEGLFDTPVQATAPTPATAFTPPYADAVDTPAASWDDAPAPSLPPSTAAEQATFAPAAAEGGSLVRRWGAPIALVAAGLVGGMVATTAITNASAAPAGVVQPAGSRVSDDGGMGLADEPGITIEQLSPDGDHDLDGFGGEGVDADGDGRVGPGGHDHGGYSLSDGFSLRDGAPSTQGSTGASR